MTAPGRMPRVPSRELPVPSKRVQFSHRRSKGTREGFESVWKRGARTMRWFTLFFVLTLPTAVFAKCEPEMIPTWDPEAADFVCKSRGPGVANQPEDHSPQSFAGFDRSDRTEFCLLDQAERIRSCPQGRAGQCCRDQVSAITRTCLTLSGESLPASCRPPAAPSPPATDETQRTTTANCEQMYQARFRACSTRTVRPSRTRSPEDASPAADDTTDQASSESCFRTAADLRDACLAQAR
jgi:hypothetical protein